MDDSAFNLVVFYISRKGIQESDDVIDVFLRQLFAQLRFAHDADGFIQIPHAAVVEVGVGHGHVAQAGHVENIFVIFGLSHFKAAFVVLFAAGEFVRTQG